VLSLESDGILHSIFGSGSPGNPAMNAVRVCDLLCDEICMFLLLFFILFDVKLSLSINFIFRIVVVRCISGYNHYVS